MRMLWMLAAFLLSAGTVNGQGAYLSPCGGMQGILCDEGYVCERDISYPDSPGICLKPGETRPRANSGRVPAAEIPKANVPEEFRRQVEEGTFGTTILATQRKFREEIRARRGALETEIISQRLKLRQDLAAVKEERKRQAVERIADSIQKLNDTRVEHFLEATDRLQQIQVRILERLAVLERGGQEVGTVRRALDFSYRATTVAREAIAEQAGRTYAVTVGDENSLRSDVGASRAALRADLKFVEQRVKTAHEALRQAALEFGRVAIEPDP